MLFSQMRPPTVIDFVTDTRSWPKSGEIWPNKKPWRLPLAASIVFFFGPSKVQGLWSIQIWVYYLKSKIAFQSKETTNCHRVRHRYPILAKNWRNLTKQKTMEAASVGLCAFLAPQRSKVYDLSKSIWVYFFKSKMVFQSNETTNCHRFRHQYLILAKKWRNLTKQKTMEAASGGLHVVFGAVFWPPGSRSDPHGQMRIQNWIQEVKKPRKCTGSLGENKTVRIKVRFL